MPNGCASSCATSSSPPAVNTTIGTRTTAPWWSKAASPCSSSRLAFTATDAERSDRKDLRLVGEGLELECVAGRVVEEHRPLLADSSGEAHIRLDDEPGACGAQALGK